MKMITLAAAAILMASTAAHAGSGISFEINGQKIHVESPRNCDALSCIKITAPGLNLKGFNLGGGSSDDDTAVASNAPAQTSTTAPAVTATAPQPTAPVGNSAPAAPVASTAPAVVASTSPVTNTVAPADPAPVVTPPSVSANPAPNAAPVQQPAPVSTTAAPAPTSPLGVWATEENKGNVRIEACGTNLCGYADKTGEKILINMKPSDNKWVGRIHDPDHGGNYDSTIAMKGPNALKVQGCAFGGMFCGGQTWKRVS
jgi:uncharacterized protein (DUF2147 family)